MQDAKAADHNDDKGHLAHQRAILEEAEVVCSTCAGADHPVLQGKDFGCVLIDEAGQTTELAVLVPLMKMRKDGVVTLVGDHRQLPPTISNVEVDVEGLGTSLFERLSSHGVEPFMLDIQYRIPALNFLSSDCQLSTNQPQIPICEMTDSILRTLSKKVCTRPSHPTLPWPATVVDCAVVSVAVSAVHRRALLGPSPKHR